MKLEQPLPHNTAIAHYRLLAPLGAGGMGEVYLAEDTKLSRKVALKLLPDEFARDAGRMRRFEQEARAASALNHPNILTIFEIGEANGERYIAKAADGSRKDTRLHKSDYFNYPSDWSREGRFIIYNQIDPKTNKYDVWSYL